MRDQKVNDRNRPSPHQTGHADFPHPAFAGRLSAKHSQIGEAEVVEVRIDRGARWGAPTALAAPAQMAREPMAHHRIDLPEGVPGVSLAEVVGPTSQVAVEFINQFRQRLEAALAVDHPAQLFALSRQGFA